MASIQHLNVAGTVYDIEDATVDTKLLAKANLVNGKVPLSELPEISSNVIANPQVIGTEATLSALQVGSTKYIVRDEDARDDIEDLEGMLVYSASEHVVGEFMGNTLYARTVQFTIPAGTTSYYSIGNYSTWGINQIVEIKCTSYSTVDNGSVFPTMWYNHVSQSFGVWTYCSNNQIIISSTNMGALTGGYATVYYTKA